MKSTKTNRAKRVIARCLEIAACTEVPGQTTRRFLSSPMHRVHALLRGWMEAAGMAVRIDDIGNLRGLWPGLTADAPRLLIGSHLDTIPNAGAFDGILGVVLGVAIIEELHGKHLPFAIEIIGFSEEEGVRFSKPFLGSLALIGKLDPAILTRTDRNGLSIADAIRAFGLDPANLAGAAASPGTFGYLEIHIEQGPLLESENEQLGIVEALVGQTRMQFTFTGHANHAGTTPMHLRHDAMSAAAEWIVAVEAYALAHSGLVATVGSVETVPGAVNVIAGRVTASLDVRHPNDRIRRDAVLHFRKTASCAASRRGLLLDMDTHLDQAAVPLDPTLIRILHTAALAAGFPSRRMTSGAGHDAMIVAQRIPSAMLFLHSPGGISHHPDESVRPQDVEAALATAMEFLLHLRDDRANSKDGHA